MSHVLNSVGSRVPRDRIGMAVAPRPPTFRKTNAPADPFVADALGLVTMHDGILKQRAWRAVFVESSM